MLKQVFEDIKTSVKKQKTAVFFDLDSTLFDVHPRTEAILKQLLEDQTFKAKYGDLTDQLKSVTIEKTDWGIRDAVLRHKIEGPPEFLNAIKNYWRFHFFHDRLLIDDPVYPGSDKFVQAVHDAGAHVYYLTGRDQIRMRKGTIESLNRWSFPNVDDQHLYMKPSTNEEDENFKANILKEKTNEYAKIFFFENEPVIISKVRRENIDVEIIFVDTIHSQVEVSPRDLVSIKEFKDFHS